MSTLSCTLVDSVLLYRYLSIIPTWCKSIMNVDCSAVINLLPVAQNILKCKVSCQGLHIKQHNLSKGVNKKWDLSVKPTIAASAGTKLPMCDRKTIKATWKKYKIYMNWGTPPSAESVTNKPSIYSKFSSLVVLEEIWKSDNTITFSSFSNNRELLIKHFYFYTAKLSRNTQDTVKLTFGKAFTGQQIGRRSKSMLQIEDFIAVFIFHFSSKGLDKLNSNITNTSAYNSNTKLGNTL